MRNRIQNLLALGILLNASVFAQATGTVTLTGTIPQAASLTIAATLRSARTLTLGTLVATNNTTLAAITPLDVRGAQQQAVQAERPDDIYQRGQRYRAGGDSIAASDIGFGITAVASTGANVVAGRAEILTAKFNYTTTPMSAA